MSATAETNPNEYKVFAGVELSGALNTNDEELARNINYAIRQQHPQLFPQPLQMERVCLVGGGPSLADTEQELVELLRQGAKLVTVNGAYQWCLARNLTPQAQIVVDARAHNARFVDPELPGCRYYVASQAHPETWRALEGRPWVGIFHCSAEDNTLVKPILDAYYKGQWHGVTGGSTVILRAIGLLRMLGYLRFDLFGVDSCWMGEQHHAYQQDENGQDSRLRVVACPSDRPDLAREFIVAPWHLSQAEDFVRFVRFAGDAFLLHVHGNGLLAYLLASGAEMSVPTPAGAQSA